MKSSPREQLVEAVRRTLNGGSPLNRELAMKLLRRLASEKEQQAQPLPEPIKGLESLKESLTAQELEVLRLLAVGQTNQQIAHVLFLSESSVKVRVRSVVSKLGVSDRTQAAVRAIELGLAISGFEE